jgi:transcriptional regulator of acetoin/glycerol metabolism
LPDASRPPHSGHAPSPRLAASRELAHARECFLTFDDVTPGVVRPPILASWRRSRDFHVSADHFELQYAPNPDRAGSLSHSANQIINEASAQFSNEPVSVILTDSDGVVLQRNTGDS